MALTLQGWALFLCPPTALGCPFLALLGAASGNPSRRHLSRRHEAHTALHRSPSPITLLPALERPRNEAPYPSYLPGMFTPLRCLRRLYAAHHAEALPRRCSRRTRPGLPARVEGRRASLPARAKPLSDKHPSDYPLIFFPSQKTRGHFSRRVVAYLWVNT